MAKDPVCGMDVEPSEAAVHTLFEGSTYYFCCVQCRGLFEKNPRKFTLREESGCGRCGGCCGGAHRGKAAAA